MTKLADLLSRQKAALKAEAKALADAADKDSDGKLTGEAEARFSAIEADIAVIDASSNVEAAEAVETRVRGECLEVAETCALAGKADMAAGFIKAKTPLAEVRTELQTARAKEATAIQNRNPQQGQQAKGDGWGKATAKINARVKG